MFSVHNETDMPGATVWKVTHIRAQRFPAFKTQRFPTASRDISIRVDASATVEPCGDPEIAPQDSDIFGPLRKVSARSSPTPYSQCKTNHQRAVNRFAPCIVVDIWVWIFGY